MESENANNARALAAQQKIKKDRLSQNQYTISLLNEGIRVGMLTREEVHDIQSQLMLILKSLISRYTQGASSSVTSETAESIMTSILYAVDACTLHFDDPEKAVTYLKAANISNIYEKGVDLVRQCFEETKQLYKEMNSRKLDVEVDAYNMTIDESIPVFLRKYGIIFDAHNTMASIDYPLAIDDMHIQGVFYIKQYLEHLKMETEFCRLFNQQDLQKMLVNFGKVCRFDYRIELFNIFELVFNNAIFSVLSEGEADHLKISSDQYEQLDLLFTKLNASQIRFVIHKALDQLRCDLKINAPQMTDYMNQCGNELTQRVIKAAEHHSLHAVIMTEKEAKPRSFSASFREAERMNDSRFRLLIEEITKCETTENKVQLIKSNVYSLQDYIDMLNSNCLFGNEFKALFRTFGDTELAILAKIVFYEELRNDFLDFSSIIASGREPETEWQMHYIKFLQNIGKKRMSLINELIHDIDYEEIKFD